MASPAVELQSPEFLDNFLAVPSVSLRDSPRILNFFKKLENADNMRGTELATHLVDAINEYDLSAPLFISQYTRDSSPGSDSTKGIGIFRHLDVRRGQPPHWANALIPIEFGRYVAGADPFDNGKYDDKYGDLEWRRKQLLKQITATAEHLYAAHQRVSLFVLLVIGRRFRILRFDRAGIIVTPSVDYYEHPDALCDFLCRAARLDDASLGFDPTASRILPGGIDYLRMDNAALEDPHDVDHEERCLQENEITGPVVFKYVRSAFRDSLKNDWPRHKLQVPDGCNTRQFLVGKPVFRTSGATGRGTRGYIAYDCQTRRLLWLKDAWRASYVIADTEGDVLARLNAANVTNIPTLVCHGDINNQTTITADWWERKRATSSTPTTPPASSSSISSHTLTASASPNGKKRKIQESSGDDENTASSRRHRSPDATIRSDCPLRQHTHYRIVVEEVCMPLKSFKCGRQLVSLLLDSLHAHYEAATNPKTRLLHRDISSGNILIYPKVRCRKAGKKPSLVWTGLLCDWELAKPVDDQNTPSRLSQAGRMGTYQFMSVNLLSNLENPVKIADELESFFHVLVYYSVRYLQSSCDEIDSFVQGYFHNYAGPQRLYGCGQKSVLMEVTGKLQTDIPYGPLLFDSPMDNLIAFTLECFRSRYKILEHACRIDVQSPPPPVVTTPSSPCATAPPSTCASERPFDDVDEDDVIDWDAPIKYDGPTPEDEERAKKIADHKFMLDIFAKALRQPLWAMDDRIAVPPGPAVAVAVADADATSERRSTAPSQQSVDLASTSTSTSNKRRRMAGPLAERTDRDVQARTMPVRARPQGVGGR
ncbi:hypothetical protein LXA43DRAFT_1078177 [Ganoderma leucocontextum]|nr:hypothetical protein LXA43DRAFT_1078177 [Ganoderma leucocontextum]